MAEIKKDNLINEFNSFSNNAYFKGLAETLQQIVILADPENYTIQYINKQFPSTAQESLIGKSIFNFVVPENIQLFKNKIEEVKQSKKTLVFELGENYLRVNENTDWQCSCISIISENDESIKSIMFTIDNILESKLKEIEINNKSERIKSIINNTDDFICSIDNAWKFTEFNFKLKNRIKIQYKVDLEIGMSVFDFVDPKTHDHLRLIYKKVLNGEKQVDIQRFDTISGHVVYNETNYNPIYNISSEIIGINIFSKDISNRIKEEQNIKDSLKEKEILLSEIHHRIKNNLALVSSLLQLQEMNINNEEAKEALRISSKRIKSTALIHELLYRNESFNNINFKEYLSELFNLLKINNNIKLSIKGIDLSFNINKALPLGLMLNEIMLNSFKHSYKNTSEEGHTEITLDIIDNLATIIYCDCKGSFPETVDFKNSNTTGLTLINTFAEQLNGSIELVNHTPPKYIIQIPLDEL